VSSAVETQRRLVAALGLPILETHISYVLLTGEFAYKIKKAVNLEFLDFTTLEARRFFCGEELRLNRRLAPSIYLDVVPISGTVDAPVLGGSGPALEYAVRMTQFDEEGLLSRVIARDELTATRVDALAAVVASFHATTPRAGADLPYGGLEAVMESARQNFSQLSPVVTDPGDRSKLEQLRDWTEREGATRAAAFVGRRADGFVRECHGDLHLGNIAIVDGQITLFDCIEFNAAMRWIDVMSDVAFLVMDLRDRNRLDLAGRFLSAYLESTGDYSGLQVLLFYVTYRAVVRAKIAALRMDQTTSPDQRRDLSGECRTYLDLAVRGTQSVAPTVVITHGVTGSGKTTRAEALVESLGAIRIRSDVERKRRLGLDPMARTNSPIGGGLYTADADRQTYAHLAALTRTVVECGYTVVVDAAFLKRWQRDLLRDFAASRGLRFVIADCSAPPAALRERVMRRTERGHDASEATLAVLEHQLATEDPLSADELPFRQ
jgi:uncharacterized protein